MKKIIIIVVSLLILVSIPIIGFATNYDTPKCIQPIEVEEPIPGK